jgi:hypothetical protein
MAIDSRSELIYALSEVAELEHTLMCQYLFAAASLKTHADELSGNGREYYQIEMIRKWKRELLLVAREEMQHLTYAINLMISVGGSPTFTRPNFPNITRFYKQEGSPKGAFMTLAKFEESRMQAFIQFEASPPQAGNKHMLAINSPDPNYYATLHQFYSDIQSAFTDEMFVNYKDQYNPVDGNRTTQIPYRNPINNVVTTARDARKLIDLIMEQGEGSDANDERAHALIFSNIHQEYIDEKRIDNNFDPCRNVLPNPMTRIADDVQLCLINDISLISKDLDEGLPYALLQLFNSAYETMLCWLYQVFDRRGTPEELAAIESLAFLPFMSQIIRPLMEFLTRIPVIGPDGKEARLGAGFEISSNSLLIPKPQLTFILSKERLADMEKSANKILTQINKSTRPEIVCLAEDFAFIAKSFSILTDEFESRVLFGVKGHSAPDLTFSENSESLKPSKIDPSMVTFREWNVRGPAVLNLEFQGWFQVRLPSDPDGANDKRGVSGNSFAVGKEPDFDRILRFQEHRPSMRSHSPSVNVAITRARILHPPTDLNIPGTDVPQFQGARLNLLDDARFQGRNNLVSGVGEPIDPFRLEILTTDGIRLVKSVNSDKSINDMRRAQRMGTGRYLKDAAIHIEKTKEYLRRTGYLTPHEFLKERISLLEKDCIVRQASHGDLDVEVVTLKHRLDCLYETLDSAQGEAVPGFIRWTRFFFHFNYRHTLSRCQEIDLNGINLPFEFKTENPLDYRTKWLIDYNMGFFDSDSHCGFTYGSIQIPIDLK